MKHIKPEYIDATNLARTSWFPFSSHNTVLKHIRNGNLPAIQLLNGRYMILIKDAKAYAKKLKKSDIKIINN